MKVTALALLALFGALGVALGMNYGGYQYVPVYPGQGGAGYQDSSFLMLIGFLFLFLVLFQSGLFNTTSSSTSTTTATGVTVISG